VSQLTGKLTRLVVEGNRSAMRRLRIGVGAGTVAAALLAAGVGALAGPMLVRLVFGDQVRIGAPASSLVAAGSALALGNLVLTVATMARNRSHASAAAWVVGAVGAAVVYAVQGPAPLARVCWAFVAAEALAFAALLTVDVRSSRSGDGPLLQ
jgi:O-antigen/teichoic acid export membrane protein